jgi:hypothetical protein
VRRSLNQEWRTTMRISAAAVFAVALSLGSTAFADPPPATLSNGLVRAQGSKVALAYVRPGTNWSKYKTIQLRTLSVPPNARNAAPKGQMPEFGESYLLSDQDVAQLQQDFAKSMHNILGNAGFTFVTTPQADTLVVIPQIARIQLNAPIQDSRIGYSGMSATFSQGGGSITMSAVLADAQSGKVIAEALDRQYGSNTWGLNNSTTNMFEAREAFDQWARDLRDRLKSP